MTLNLKRFEAKNKILKDKNSYYEYFNLSLDAFGVNLFKN